jgi:hypothetical protein
MSTKLGMAKVYFNLGDFGKMLKLKDINNLAITDIQKSESDRRLVLSLVTPMDNATNSRVASITESDYIPLRKLYIQEIIDEFYILSIDMNMIGDNYGVLFKCTEQGKKIIKIINIPQTLKLHEIADILINELKPYKNSVVMTSNVGIGMGLIDNLKAKYFNKIAELDMDDIRTIATGSLELMNDKSKLYKYISEPCNTELLKDFVELVKELDNLEVKQNGNKTVLDMKSKEIGKSRIMAVLQCISCYS